MAKLCRLALLLSLLMVASAAMAQESDDEDAAVTKTRFGQLTVVDDESDALIHKLLLGGKEILSYEGEALSVDGVYKAGTRDLVLVGESSGGSGCPYMFVIVQLEAKKAPVVSDEFGTCSDVSQPRIDADKLVVEMPVYVSHPDEWDEKELADAEKSTVVYTWANGKLTEKTVKK
jgi:hypothetical protein